MLHEPKVGSSKRLPLLITQIGQSKYLQSVNKTNLLQKAMNFPKTANKAVSHFLQFKDIGFFKGFLLSPSLL